MKDFTPKNIQKRKWFKKITLDRIFHMNAACGVRNKYEVCWCCIEVRTGYMRSWQTHFLRSCQRKYDFKENLAKLFYRHTVLTSKEVVKRKYDFKKILKAFEPFLVYCHRGIGVHLLCLMEGALYVWQIAGPQITGHHRNGSLKGGFYFLPLMCCEEIKPQTYIKDKGYICI